MRGQNLASCGFYVVKYEVLKVPQLTRCKCITKRDDLDNYVTFMILQSFVGFCLWCVQRGAGRTHCRNYWWISRDRNSTNRRKYWDYGYDFECSTKTFFEEKTWLFIGYRSCWKGIVFLKATYLYVYYKCKKRTIKCKSWIYMDMNLKYNA